MSKYSPGAEGLLSPLKTWLDNPNVSEILMNKAGEAFIEERGEMFKVSVPELTDERVMRLFHLIANENKQTLAVEKPLLSGNLADGSRIQIVLPPTASNPTLSIRRSTMKNMQLILCEIQGFFRGANPFYLNKAHEFDTDDELKEHYQSRRWYSFIEQAIIKRKNIIISGGTSSGKTTFLNACLREIPKGERIIILEDTREIDIPHENKVQLLASKHEQGLAKVSMQDLVQCCLRLRPDRIIMGEIRGKEILDFISACSTGHEGSLTTIHANNPEIAFMRMVQMYKLNNVPAMTDEDILRELKAVIDIIIQVEKMPEGRRVKSIYYKGA